MNEGCGKIILYNPLSAFNEGRGKRFLLRIMRHTPCLEQLCVHFYTNRVLQCICWAYTSLHLQEHIFKKVTVLTRHFITTGIFCTGYTKIQYCSAWSKLVQAKCMILIVNSAIFFTDSWLFLLSKQTFGRPKSTFFRFFLAEELHQNGLPVDFLPMWQQWVKSQNLLQLRLTIV